MITSERFCTTSCHHCSRCRSSAVRRSTAWDRSRASVVWSATTTSWRRAMQAATTTTSHQWWCRVTAAGSVAQATTASPIARDGKSCRTKPGA